MVDREKLNKLRAEGKTYREIGEIFGYTASKVRYHCNAEALNKYYKEKKLTKVNYIIYEKIRVFSGMNKSKTKQMLFTVQDVLDKFGQYTECYLTGKKIDLSDRSAWQMDHIQPRSSDKGEDNSIGNLGIVCPEANMAKHALSLKDFIKLCKTIAARF